jgi:glycosyltransferase involved in cell wall biosynthesis
VLVPPADVAALADALSALIASPEARAQLGSAGPERARNLCDPAATIGRLHDLLSRVVRPRDQALRVDCAVPQ